MKVNDILDDLELGTCLLWEDIDYEAKFQQTIFIKRKKGQNIDI